ncbi:hypothetical protein ACOMHN_009062 [Nucella lapillus]
MSWAISSVVLRQQAHAVDVLGHLHDVLTQTDSRPMLWMSWAISMMSSDSRPMLWMSWAISMMSSDRQQAHAVNVLGHLHDVLTQTDSRPMLWMSWAISMMSSDRQQAHAVDVLGHLHVVFRQTAGPCCGCPGASP